MNGLTGRVLVTGADRGLGLGFVGHYLGEGRLVVATTRRSQPSDDLAALGEQFPEYLQVMRLDAADESSIADFAAKAGQQGLTFDLVINNAGVSIEEPYGQWTSEIFTRHFLINTVGPALVVQAIDPMLVQGAKVIQISSGVGSAELNVNPDAGLDAYAASKSALNILARRLATKLRPRNITVVAMSPGWVQTDMGGGEAPSTVDESVNDMVATIDGIPQEATGSFLAKDSSVIPW